MMRLAHHDMRKASPTQAGLPGLSQLRTLSLAHCTGLTRDGLGFAAPLPNLTFLRCLVLLVLRIILVLVHRWPLLTVPTPNT